DVVDVLVVSDRGVAEETVAREHDEDPDDERGEPRGSVRGPRRDGGQTREVGGEARTPPGGEGRRQRRGAGQPKKDEVQQEGDLGRGPSVAPVEDDVAVRRLARDPERDGAEAGTDQRGGGPVGVGAHPDVLREGVGWRGHEWLSDKMTIEVPVCQLLPASTRRLGAR